MAKHLISVVETYRVDSEDEVARIIKEQKLIACTGCRYCMPCPFGVNIPENFTVYNRHAMGEVLNNEWYKKMEYPKDATASLCVQCGACIKKCPQGINIPEVLKETLKEQK
mgnify:CR=1 FL=1